MIAGERLNTTTPEGLGAMLRAYDKATGREVGAVYMPAPQSGSPMTYLLNGEQYLVVAISGAQYAGELLGVQAAAALASPVGWLCRRRGVRPHLWASRR